jgi:hypothetical protein
MNFKNIFMISSVCNEFAQFIMLFSTERTANLEFAAG